MIRALKRFLKQRYIAKDAFVSYSQDGEDMILRSFYEEKFNYKGFYVDVGAHDPERFSNTMFFYKMGWSGINIEPTPNAITRFNACRPRDINLNFGVGERHEELTFYCFNEPALNSFSEELSHERDGEKQYYITEKIPVQVCPLSEIFDKHLPAETRIDFLSIDVEGFDLQVLRSNSWVKYRPDYILAEDAIEDMGQLKDSNVYNFVVDQGYKLVAKTQRTLIFKNKEL